MDGELPVLVLRASRAKLFGLAAFSVGVSAMGFFMSQRGEAVTGYAVGIIGLIVALVLLLQTLPKASFLQIDPEGLSMASLFRVHRYRWQDLASFGVTKVGLNTTVGLNFSAEFLKTRPSEAAAGEFMQGINGFHGALPSLYGRGASELSQYLNDYRAQALAK